MRVEFLFSTIIALCASVSRALPAAQGWELLLFYTAWQSELSSGVTPRYFAGQANGGTTTFREFLAHIITAQHQDRLNTCLEAARIKDVTGGKPPLNLMVNLTRLYVHPPAGPHVWAGALTLAADSLRNSLAHTPQVIHSAQAATEYMNTIANIRTCDSAPWQIKRLRFACNSFRMGKRKLNIVLKQGPGPVTCQVIDYPATWAASPSFDAAERTQFEDYMSPAAQKPENRDHLANIAAASQGVEELRTAIHAAEGRHVRKF